jgi:hypothetical protein
VLVATACKDLLLFGRGLCRDETTDNDKVSSQVIDIAAGLPGLF